MKYPKTYHLPWSEGTTNDDKIAENIRSVINHEIVILEKLDGSNTAVNEKGVFNRSHATPSRNPWTEHMKEKWGLLVNDIGNLEIYGENMYAIHSIEYSGLDRYYYIFAIRDNNKILSWDEIEEYAELFNMETVPVLFRGEVHTEKELEELIDEFMDETSELSDDDIWPTPKEGVVVRPVKSFKFDNFSENVFKLVRSGHVQTSEHWRKNWKRAFLNYELKRMGNPEPRKVQ